jgi:hypothetical protein
MKRRTLLQFLATALVAPLGRLRLVAQSAPELSASQLATLEAVAEVALPSAVDAAGRAALVRRFAAWVQGYREGADMGHGYGSSNLRRPAGPSPALAYPPQFEALDAAAVAAGASFFAALDPAARRTLVQRALDEPDRISRLPGTPNGQHLVADFLGFYFNSPDAWDLCYQAEIGADRCRSLDGSDRPPAPIGGR